MYSPSWDPSTMASDINNTIEEFCRKYLSPSIEERTAISKRYKELQELLPGNTLFQSGSYARETSVNTVHDLDVIWVMPEHWQTLVQKAYTANTRKGLTFNVSQPLEELAQYLRAAYFKRGVSVVIDSSQRHAVKIAFGTKDKKIEDFTIDVVPAVRSGRKNEFGDDIFLVPEIQKRKHRDWEKIYMERKGDVRWILSDPKFYVAQAENLNKSNPCFRKAAKFIKIWRRACNAGLVGFELQSFHTELLATELFLKEKLDVFDAVCLFLSNLDDWLSSPWIKDHANGSIYVDNYLDEDIGNIARLQIACFARQSLDALKSLGDSSTAEDIYDAIRLAVKAPAPWAVCQKGIVSIPLECTIERKEKDKLRNRTTFNPRYPALPKSVLQQINGPRKISSGEEIKPRFRLLFSPQFGNLPFDQIKWLVVNNGTDALEKKKISGWRGFEFQDCDSVDCREEYSEYIGKHWVECYLLRANECVGFGQFIVNIVT